MSIIPRRKTLTAVVGGVRVGSDAPVMVQSMTNTDTADIPGTIKQVAALARAGSEVVRVTVNNDDAAKAIPHIVDGLAKLRLSVPIVGDFHYNGHLLLTKYPGCARGPGQVPHQSWQCQHRAQERRQLPHHDRSRREAPEAGAHRRELGIARSVVADQDDGRELAPPRAERRPRRDHGSDGGERAQFREAGRAVRTAPRSDHPQRKSQRRAGSDRRLPRARRPLRLPAASRPHRSRHGRERRGRIERGHGRGAAGRHRRHHPRLVDPCARRRPHRRSPRGAADSAIHGHSQLYAAGYSLPRLRTHHQHLLPGNGASRFRLTCASRCPHGKAATSASKR